MAAEDKHATLSEALLAPADDVEGVVPHDSTELAVVSRAIYVGGAGNLAVLMKNGVTATFQGVPAGTLLPIRVRRVNATGTTATNILSVY